MAFSSSSPMLLNSTVMVLSTPKQALTLVNLSGKYRSAHYGISLTIHEAGRHRRAPSRPFVMSLGKAIPTSCECG
jgi:hypothetical protein